MSMFNRRIVWIDYCRAFAICLVIIGHILISTSSYNSHIDNMIMVIIYSFHMPLFFILSGLVFKKTGILDGIKKRFIRLMIPYFGFCILEFVYKLMFYSLVNREILDGYLTSFTKEQIIDSMLMNSSSAFSGYWFLPVLFCSSIFMTALLKFNNKACEYICMLLGISISAWLKFCNIELPLGMGEALLSVPFIYIGFKEKESDYSRLKNPWVFIIVIVGYVGALAYWKYMNYEMADMHNSAVRNPLAFYVLGLCGSYIVMFCIKGISSVTLSFMQPTKHCLLMKKCWEYIGTRSLYIYGMHYLFLEAWSELFSHYQLNIKRWEIINFRFLGFAITLLGCSIVIRFAGFINAKIKCIKMRKLPILTISNDIKDI